MNDSDVLAKTKAGLDELGARSRRLPPRLRTLLILTDGAMNLGQLHAAAAALGAPADALQQLLDAGLIEGRASTAAPSTPEMLASNPPSAGSSEADRFRVAQKFINDNVVDALGFRAFFFTLRVEKCFTRADLRALLPTFVATMAKQRDAQTARVLEARALELLADPPRAAS